MSRLERMKSYLPEHFAESPEIIAILEDGNRRFGELDSAMDDVLNQFFVETATWGLDKWEEELEILPTTTDFPARRNQIISKLISQTPTHYKAIENEVNRFLSSEPSSVRLIPGRYAMNITIPLMNDFIRPYAELKKAVEEMKPAHLRAIFILLDKIETEREILHKALLKKKLRPDTTWWGGQYNPDLGVLINGSWRIDGGFLLNATASEEDPINKIFFRETMKMEKPFQEYEENLALILDGNWTLNNVHTLDNPPKLVKLRPIQHDITIFERKVYERRIDGTWYLDGSLTVGVQRLMNGSWSMDGEYLMDGNRMQEL